MIYLETLFWLGLFIMFYTYIGYPIVLYLLVKIKRSFGKKPNLSEHFYPSVAFIVAAYNEEDYIEDKIKNTLSLDYPKDKLKVYFVTDGSNDNTPKIIAKYPEITLLHRDERKGKMAAIERTMKIVEEDISVFTDANTTLPDNAIKLLVNPYQNPNVGAVAGEKRIFQSSEDTASSAGEGFYWKYESTLKKWDSQLHTVVGAAGELFSIRTTNYEDLPADTLLDDFMMSMKIVEKGQLVKYVPDAYAIETASANIEEELKRKVRISAGGIQSITRLTKVLNPFKYGMATFQYLSHRVLRWTLAPLSILFVLVSNLVLALNDYSLYPVLLTLQLLFYLTILIGKILKNQSIEVKGLFVPYYFFIMNWSVYLGFFRFIKGSQSVLWEKAKRKA
ncbi:glycosyltransferase family 2 protein [Limibacter armeniacum]|uniref:glycosyltransferase family 2 protein n=1 Tax=Limibacter armeniacum TaxID=466084 RepID=UPI002FE53A7E